MRLIRPRRPTQETKAGPSPLAQSQRAVTLFHASRGCDVRMALLIFESVGADGVVGFETRGYVDV